MKITKSNKDGIAGLISNAGGASAIGGTPVCVTTPTTGDVLTFDGTEWCPDTAPGSALTIEDEGTPLATAATSLDFVGAGVTASGTGAAKTITIPGDSGVQLASITAASSAIAATETVVVSASLSAGAIVAGNSYRISGAGVGTTGLTPGTDTFRIRIGTTTLTGTIPATATAVGVASVTAQPFSFVALITARTDGAGGTVIGECAIFSANVATGRYVALVNLSAVVATVALDTTATNLLELTYQSGNAGSSNVFHVATIEQLTGGTGATGSGGTPTYHGVKAYYNTTLSLAASTPMSFNSELWDTDDYHDTVTDNSRLTVPVGLAGRYFVRGYLYWDNGSSRDLYLAVNTVPIAGCLVYAAVGPDEVTGQVTLAEGDYVTLFHGGATVTVGHASVIWAQCTLEMFYLGPTV